MKNIKIVFFDIDGTLIGLDKENISEKTVFALNALKEKGIIICIATGRAAIQVPKFDGVDFDCFLTFNGSLCFNKDEEIYSNPLKDYDVETFIKNAACMDKPISLAAKDSCVADYLDCDLDKYFSFSNSYPKIVEDCLDFAKKNNIYQVYMSLNPKEYDKALTNIKDSKITAWWDRAVDIIPKNSGKGQAIERILDYYGFSKDEALAFGDGNNDIDMFKTVNGIAMDNASSDLKEVSYDVCKSVDCDGIFYYLKDKNII